MTRSRFTLNFTNYLVQFVVNSRVVALDDCTGTPKNTPATIPVARLLANDTNAAGFTLQITASVSGPWISLGNFTALSNGQIEHTATNPPIGTMFFPVVPPSE